MPNALGPDIVLFDGACALCRSLAELAGRRAGAALRFVAWDEFRASEEGRAALPEATAAEPALQLRVLTASGLLSGEHAWGFLLESYQDLAGLNWLAAKLGLTRPAAAALQSTAAFLRRLCYKCPRR